MSGGICSEPPPTQVRSQRYVQTPAWRSFTRERGDKATIVFYPTLLCLGACGRNVRATPPLPIWGLFSTRSAAFMWPVRIGTSRKMCALHHVRTTYNSTSAGTAVDPVVTILLVCRFARFVFIVVFLFLRCVVSRVFLYSGCSAPKIDTSCCYC